jgi:hypothetical protein
VARIIILRKTHVRIEDLDTEHKKARKNATEIIMAAIACSSLEATVEAEAPKIGADDEPILVNQAS